MGILGAGEIILILLFFFVVAVPFALMITALVDIMKSSLQSNDKLLWVLIVILVPVFGAIIYFIMGKRRKDVVS